MFLVVVEVLPPRVLSTFNTVSYFHITCPSRVFLVCFAFFFQVAKFSFQRDTATSFQPDVANTHGLKLRGSMFLGMEYEVLIQLRS